MIINILIAILFFVLGISIKVFVLWVVELTNAIKYYKAYKKILEEDKASKIAKEKFRKKQEKLRID